MKILSGYLFLSCAVLILPPSLIRAQVTFDLPVSSLAVTDSPNPTFYVGTSQGIFRSERNLNTLTPVHVLPAGQEQPSADQIFTDGQTTYIRSKAPESALWRSIDNGASWTRIMVGLPGFDRLNELFLLPGNPSSLLVYLTIGTEGQVYRSDDGGDSWTFQTALRGDADQFGVNLNNADIMFSNSGRQIWRSLNGGRAWSTISIAPFPVDSLNGVVFLVPDPLNPNNVILGGGGNAFNEDGIFRSTDQGSTWTRALSTTANTLIYGPDWPYFFHQASATTGSVDVSRDRGQSWVRTAVSSNGVSRISAAAIDPRNDQLVYIGVRSQRQNAPLHRSADGAQTWAPISSRVFPTLGGPESVLVELPQGAPPRRVLVGIRSLENPDWDVEFTADDPGLPWLTVDNRQGSTESGLNVTLDPEGLPLGEHRADITVRSDQTVNSEIVVTVVLRVVDALSGNAPAINTVAGNGRVGITGDGGPATEAGLGLPSNMAVGPDGSIYLTYEFDDLIRRVDAEGRIDRFAGTGEAGFSGDGGPALAAQVDSPDDIAVAPDGTVYFADRGNRRVRKINSRGVITTVAGNGEAFGQTPAAGNDATQVAMNPDLVAADADGNLYVYFPAVRQSLFVVERDGSYHTFATGIPQLSSDLIVDAEGRLFLALDSSNQVARILAGTGIEIFAGNGAEGYTGDGGPALQATFRGPAGLALGNGMVFISDQDNHVVRGVDSSLQISTIAGVGSSGFSGDGGPARFAELSHPEALGYLDERLYVLDRWNRRVRVIDFATAVNPGLTTEGIVNSAGFKFNEISPGENISIFGLRLATETAVAPSTPLPAELAGTRVSITDAGGTARPCRLFFVASGQINCNVDDATVLGPGTLTVETSGGGSISIPIVVVPVAPGLFAANANGTGVAAAVGIRIDAAGTQSVVEVFNASGDPRTAVPIELGPDSEQVVLLLFGTGFRNFQNSVEVTIGGQQAQVAGVAEQGEFVGLDQINVIIPRSLIGAGEVEIRLVVDGKVANIVTIRIA